MSLLINQPYIHKPSGLIGVLRCISTTEEGTFVVLSIEDFHCEISAFAEDVELTYVPKNKS